MGALPPSHNPPALFIYVEAGSEFSRLASDLRSSCLSVPGSCDYAVHHHAWTVYFLNTVQDWGNLPWVLQPPAKPTLRLFSFTSG